MQYKIMYQPSLLDQQISCVQQEHRCPRQRLGDVEPNLLCDGGCLHHRLVPLPEQDAVAAGKRIQLGEPEGIRKRRP